MTKIGFLLPAARRATAIVVAAALAGALTATTVTTTATADPNAPYNAETITFQEGLVADNAEVSTQYATAYGVEFGTGSALGFPGAALDGIDDRSPLLLTNGYQGRFTSPVLASSARSVGAEPLGGEFPPPPAFMLHLDYARANLSFLVQAFAPGSSLNGGAEVIAYRADGTEVDQTTIDELALGAWSTVTLSTTDPQGIQCVRVASLGSRDGVQIDNLELPAALATDTPSWHLATTEASVNIVEGDTATVPVEIVRQNGSSGAITVVASDASSPAISALTVDQAPTGAPPGTVDILVTASPGQVGSTATVTLSATTSTAAGSPDEPAPSIAVHVLQDLSLTVTGPGAVGNGCAAPVQEVLHAAGSTPMMVQVGGGVGLTQTVNVTGAGDYPLPTVKHAFQFSALKTAARSSTTTFRATSTTANGFAPATAALVTTEAVPRVQDISGEYVSLQQLRVFQASPVFKNTLLRARFIFSASGLPCHHLEFEVGSDAAPSAVFTPAYVPQGEMHTYNIPVPGAAFGGGARLVDNSVANAITANRVLAGFPDVTVLDLRQLDGLPFPNTLNMTNLTWSDWERTFGATNVDDCSVAGCWKDPFALATYNQVAAFAPIGLCFGFTMLVSEFFTGVADATAFGAKTPSGLQQPAVAGSTPLAVDDSSRLGQELLSDWLSQFDTNYQSASAAAFAAGVPVATFAASLARSIARDGMVFIQLKNPKGGAGHSVLAYAIASTSPTTWVIDAYNPNVPLTPSEDSVTRHTTAVTASQIVLNSKSVTAAWQMSGDLGWGGAMGGIGFTTLAQRPVDPQLATNLTEIFATPSGTSGPAPVAVAQITARGADLLGGDGAPLEGSGVTLWEPSVGTSLTGAGARTTGIYRVTPGRSYTVHTKAVRSGRYALILAGPHAVGGVASAQAMPGSSDSLSLDPDGSTFTFSSGSSSSAQLEFSAGNGPGTQTVLVDLGSGKGKTSVSLSNATVSVHRQGLPTTVGFQFLAQASVAGTSIFTLAGGATAALRPSWVSLRGPLKVTVSGLGTTEHVSLSLAASRAPFLRRSLVPRPGRRPRSR
jgi:hypothetical protein